MNRPILPAEGLVSVKELRGLFTVIYSVQTSCGPAPISLATFASEQDADKVAVALAKHALPQSEVDQLLPNATEFARQLALQPSPSRACGDSSFPADGDGSNGKKTPLSKLQSQMQAIWDRIEDLEFEKTFSGFRSIDRTIANLCKRFEQLEAQEAVLIQEARAVSHRN